MRARPLRDIFPDRKPAFPQELITELCNRAELTGILGNCHVSGTAIIEEHGRAHMRHGRPICYTSADSVFQIAAHEGTFGLERLYRLCEIARELVDPYRIGRVIARPFLGSDASNFQRTANRRDYAVPPHASTILDQATAAGRDVITVGKIADIFAWRSTGRVLKANGNAALFDRTLEGFRQLKDGGLLFANFVDFDTQYGHPRDVPGYAAALEDFDRRLPDLLSLLKPNDLLVITADHGCDPTWHGFNHTREQVPILVFGDRVTPGSIGRRNTFADVGATLLSHLNLPSLPEGTAF